MLAVVLYDPATEDRAAIAEGIAERRSMTLIHPFDDLDVMAGQGTVGLEIVEQISQRAVRPDALVVNCSGGGLASGVVTAVAQALSQSTWRRSLVLKKMATGP
jgi:threonine dehydratase